MAKHPLLGGNWAVPAAAFLLSLFLSADPFSGRAFGQENDGPADSAIRDSSPAEEKKAGDAKTPMENGAKEIPPGAAAEPKEARPKAPAAADAKPSPSKSAEQKEPKAEKPKDPPKLDEHGDLAVRASTLDAVYRISWLGAEIGDFKIRSSITTRQYSLQATAELSVLFGAFNWQGATTSSGLMTANGPVPQNYTFRYRTGERHESIELRFQRRMVQDILINPPQYPGARNVPITAAHLQNVVDPLSSLVLLSQARLTRGDACNKRLPIFDGKLRYDLVFSPKGTRNIGSAGKLRGTAYVCSVRFVPIAGHKIKQGDNDYATGNSGIEVWLVPVPEAGLLVPYYVQVPTPAGTASMVTAKFDVQTPAGRHALAE